MFSEQRGYFDSLTERVLGAVFEVSNTLGAGFLEKVYQRALVIELKSAERLCRMEANRPRVSAPEPIEAPPLAG